jgi:hypothetical protein
MPPGLFASAVSARHEGRNPRPAGQLRLSIETGKEGTVMGAFHSRSLNGRHSLKEDLMDRIKLYFGPVIMLIVWITVLSYTVSMVATVEPVLRRIGQMAGPARPPGPEGI